jgi:hypothetical protein
MLKLTCTLRSLLTKYRGVSPVILPGCYQPLTCAAATPTQANSRIKGSGSREVSGQTSYSHTPSKNPRPISSIQAYIAYARLKCGCGGGEVECWWVLSRGDECISKQVRSRYGHREEQGPLGQTEKRAGESLPGLRVLSEPPEWKEDADRGLQTARRQSPRCQTLRHVEQMV